MLPVQPIGQNSVQTVPKSQTFNPEKVFEFTIVTLNAGGVTTLNFEQNFDSLYIMNLDGAIDFCVGQSFAPGNALSLTSRDRFKMPWVEAVSFNNVGAPQRVLVVKLRNNEFQFWTF